MKKWDGVAIISCMCVSCLRIVLGAEALSQRSKSARRLSLVFLLCLLAGFVLLGAGVFVDVANAGNNAGAAFSIWPDTGQTKCYDDNGSEITCPAPGEPFYGQDAQYQGPQRSYTKLGYGGTSLLPSAQAGDEWIMTRDNVTGLIWEIKTDDNSIHDKDNPFYWCNTDPNTNGGDPGACESGLNTEDFITQLNNSNFGGFNDWRLPTIKELATLIKHDAGLSGSGINVDYFPYTENDYWSATTKRDAYHKDAFFVLFNLQVVSYNKKERTSHVRAVRSDNSVTQNSFTDNGDGTIIDNRTGLIWSKCSLGQTYDSATDECQGLAGVYPWKTALEAAAASNYAGYSDWRLPNRNELLSIVKHSEYSPSIDENYFPGTLSDFYWTSTTDEGSNLSYAWTVFFYNGFSIHRLKTDGEPARIVRNKRENTFDDVPPEYWAFNYVEQLSTSGVTSGCGNSNFCPTQPVTRAQMAVFLERCIRGTNFIPAVPTSPPFGDVPVDYWAGSWIKQLYEDGITSGCGGNNYCPAESVTRAQMAVFLLKSKYGSDYNPPDPIGNFNDVPTNHWAAGWIEQLADEGITSGCGNGNYCPEQPVTRAQMAVFLVRAFNLGVPPR